MTVVIIINGNPVYCRSAQRIVDEDLGNGQRCYALDDGTRIWHKPEDGIIELSKKVLDNIEPVGFSMFLGKELEKKK